jgi:DNA-binding transcriptional regulator LsrR (DeoR family)
VHHYLVNTIRAICRGYHDGYGRSEVASQFSLGSMSNISKLKKALVDRDIVEITESGCHLADPLFKLWFIREMM